MNLKIKSLLFVLFFSSINPVTLVYNIKIRRLFNLSDIQILKPEKKSLFITSAVPLVSKTDRHIVTTNLLNLPIDVFERSLIGGAVLNFRYVDKKAWWFEATTAVAKETLKSKGTSCFEVSRSGFDDIVLSAGYNKKVGQKSQFVLYGLVGFPTKKDVTVQETNNVLIGTRFYGIGAGAEFSYSFIHELKQSLNGIVQARFLHFFNRNWFPILPRDAEIQPGNATDLLLTLQYRKKRNIFEIGYNPTFFTNQAILLKNRTIQGENFVRQSMYFTASRFYPHSIFEKPLLFGIGISVSNAKRFEFKRVTFWFNFSLVF